MATGVATEALERWIDAQEAASRAALSASVSASAFRHERPEFGQSVVAAPGSVIASLHRARWDPAPDYAYHWVRDAGVVMRLAPALAARDPEGWTRRMADHVAFSLHIATRPGPAANPLRPRTVAGVARFLRPDADLQALSGDRLLGEPRANIDGTADAEHWARPQFDGPALRALACLGWEGDSPQGMAALIGLDLCFTWRHAAEPCIGPWEEEEEVDLHAFTLLAQRAALRSGMAAGHLSDGAGSTTAALTGIEAALEGLWSPAAGCLRARAGRAGASDAAVILGVLLDAGNPTSFGLADPRVLATVSWLRGWSERSFPVNASVGAPMIGRGPDDRYFGGNPWLPTTLGFAEFHYALARHVLGAEPEAVRVVAEYLARTRDTAPVAGIATLARGLMAEGDAFLETVQRFAPVDGRLPEQIDRQTGAPRSCPDLTWSHAALVSAIEARRRALTAIGAGC